jgi:antitoxin PrlF
MRTSSSHRSAVADIDADGRVRIPTAVRRRLGLLPADSLRFVLEAGDIRVERALSADELNDCFATFTEWASDDDDRAYSDL